MRNHIAKESITLTIVVGLTALCLLLSAKAHAVDINVSMLTDDCSTITVPGRGNSDSEESTEDSEESSVQGAIDYNAEVKYLFQKAVCLYHASLPRVEAPGNDAEETQEAEKREKAKQAAAMLQKAQNIFLRADVSNISHLIEGLSHCRAAETPYKNWERSVAEGTESSTGEEETDASGGQDELIYKDQFCANWLMGRVALSHVDWNMLDVNYVGMSAPSDTDSDTGEDIEGETLYSIGSLINHYQECRGEGMLSDTFSYVCNFNMGVSWTDVQKIVEDTTDIVVKNYFEGANSRLMAMFARKYEVLEGFSEKIASEKAQFENMTITSELTTYQGKYDNNKDIYSTVIQNYQDAILEGNAILQDIERLSEGLLIKYDNTDMGDVLDEKITQLNGLYDNPTISSRISRIEDISETIQERLAMRGNDSSLRRKLCQVYYCELLRSGTIDETQAVSVDTQYANNPLRISLGSSPEIVDGNIGYLNDAQEDVFQNISDICIDAGYPSSFIEIGMSSRKAAYCLSKLGF